MQAEPVEGAEAEHQRQGAEEERRPHRIPQHDPDKKCEAGYKEQQREPSVEQPAGQSAPGWPGSVSTQAQERTRKHQDGTW